MAAGARDAFESISRETSQWLQSIASRQVQQRATLQQLALEGNLALGESEYLDPYPPGIALHRSRVLALVQQTEEIGAAATDTEVQEMAESLRRAVEGLEKAVAEPPEALTQAAEAFLAGHYSRVLEILADDEQETAKASAQTDLLQAAALFALFQSRGAVDHELLEQAKSEVLSCKSVAIELPIPSPNIFSPRFIAFFEQQGGDSGSDRVRVADS